MKSSSDVALVIGAGITLEEARMAATALAQTNKINVRVMDPFTIKPLDKDAILKNAKECGGRIVVVEDHYPEGLSWFLAYSKFIFNMKNFLSSFFHAK